MALIKCAECTNEVSDSAVSCPKCGAPVKSIPTQTGPSCPFCKTSISEGAEVCKECGAQKGYVQASGNVYGKKRTIWWGIAVPIILGVVLSLFGSLIHPYFGLFILIVMLIPVLFSIRALNRGKIWFRSSNIFNQ
ncbi:zinc-ribbon domain-containing protein [Salinisphaera orenii]|uniref:zinc-ribbon domain-containing protein n=1 Tax=Salinisphaera orenii TaxID=856731 RepID=UPI000F487F89